MYETPLKRLKMHLKRIYDFCHVFEYQKNSMIFIMFLYVAKHIFL